MFPLEAGDGTVRDTRESEPSAPVVPRPQQYASPARVNAHACAGPPDTLAYIRGVVSAGSTGTVGCVSTHPAAARPNEKTPTTRRINESAASHREQFVVRGTASPSFFWM